MSNYQELYSAQVRSRARTFCYIYQKLQHLIKSRTTAGYIHGVYREEAIQDMGGDRNIRHNGETIKVTIVLNAYPPKFNKVLVIHFCTKQ